MFKLERSSPINIRVEFKSKVLSEKKRITLFQQKGIFYSEDITELNIDPLNIKYQKCIKQNLLKTQ